MLLLTLFACRNGKDVTDTGSTGPAGDDCTQTWYQDVDEDGFGADETAAEGCYPGTGWVLQGGDCVDTDAAVSPIQPEICDGIDNDCDGTTDINPEGGTTFYADVDQDGYGDAGSTVSACDAPSGYTADPTDCDDSTADTHPDADEVCDGADNDCDGDIDEDPTDAQTWFYDADGDGDGGTSLSVVECEAPSGFVSTDTDCDDLDDTVFNGADELCDDQDNDCDEQVDEDAIDQATWYTDGDGDGAGDEDVSVSACDQPSGTVDNAQDCDDDDPDVQMLTWYADSDSDGYGDESTTQDDCDQPSDYVDDDTDCDDTDDTVYPGSHETETPGDGIDTDCDGNDDCDDLNCDGWPDIVLPGHYDGNYDDIPTYIYYGSTTGYSDSNRTELTGNGSRVVQSADLDGDGYIDLVGTAYHDGSSYETDSQVWYGSASGHSDTDADSLTGYGILDACIEDLDSDGYADIVLASQYDGNYNTTSVIYWGSSGGFSSSNTTDLTSYGTRDCEIEDLDQDGYPDVVLNSYRSGSSNNYGYARIYYGDASASYTDYDQFTTYRNARLTLADIDDDGNTDLLLPRYYDGDYLTNSVAYYGSAFTDYDLFQDYGTWEMQVADLDQDGHNDVITCNYYDSNHNTNSRIWWGSTAGYSSGNRTNLTTYGCRDVDITDMDGDGWDDILFANFRSSSSYTPGTYIYYGSSTGFSTSNRDTVDSSYTYRVNHADLDGDGYQELLVSHYRDGSNYTTDSYIYWGSTTGYSSSNATGLEGVGVWGEMVVVGSID